MRHNALRDLNADLQREVCRDVVVEPRLLPLDNHTMDLTGTGIQRYHSGWRRSRHLIKGHSEYWYRTGTFERTFF